MTYFISLKIVALVIGLIYLVLHLIGALTPDRSIRVLRSLPRNYIFGGVLMIAATLWFTILTGVMDLGEISNMRTTLMLVWMAAGILVVIFVPGFLAARGLGCLLLLAAAVILDAAFLVQTPWRYVMTIQAYIWVVFGMILVYSPHLWRDVIASVTATRSRFVQASWGGVVYGVVLLALGLLVYP